MAKEIEEMRAELRAQLAELAELLRKFQRWKRSLQSNGR